MICPELKKKVPLQVANPTIVGSLTNVSFLLIFVPDDFMYAEIILTNISNSLPGINTSKMVFQPTKKLV
jgi:hypothetical protein